MILNRLSLWLALAVAVTLLVAACSRNRPDRVCVVLDTGQENDRGFNQYTLKGAREAAEEVGFNFAHVSSKSANDYEPNIIRFVDEGCDLILTVGFLMGDATAVAARANPRIRFAIIDVAYFPGAGCDEAVDDCYTAAGGLGNVTSLMFAEDEVGYLAGTLAGCMSESGVIGSVSGMEIPPVVRFVTGYQTGAREQNSAIETLNVYIPSFDDPTAGLMAAEDQIRDGADIIFGVGGNTGNGGLIAAHDAGVWAIGVDIDQYFTLEEVQPSLLTSAMKNVDIAAGEAIRAFAAGELEPGIRLSTIANGGIGLAPYHDLEEAIPADCRAAVDAAAAGLAEGAVATGYQP